MTPANGLIVLTPTLIEECNYFDISFTSIFQPFISISKKNISMTSMHLCHILYMIIYKTVHLHSRIALILISYFLAFWLVDWNNIDFCAYAFVYYAYLKHCIQFNYWLIKYWLTDDVCAFALTHSQFNYLWVVTYCCCIVDCEEVRGSLELKLPWRVTSYDYKNTY